MLALIAAQRAQAVHVEPVVILGDGLALLGFTYQDILIAGVGMDMRLQAAHGRPDRLGQHRGQVRRQQQHQRQRQRRHAPRDMQAECPVPVVVEALFHVLFLRFHLPFT